MRTLPTTYDATTVATYFSADPEGKAALRERALFIAGCVGGALLPGGPSLGRSIDSLGPSFIKFGQALANRPDLVGVSIADELRTLQDSCQPFSSDVVRSIIYEDLPQDEAREILDALPSEPTAAASIGQVYRVSLPSRRDPIALKILRPGARETVAKDAMLARAAATWLESLRWPLSSSGAVGGGRLIRPALVAGVDEFFSRLFEEMDYDNEINNLKRFNALYGRGQPAARALRRSARNWAGGAHGGAVGEILLPEALPKWSANRCLAMTWVEGEPLLRKGQATLERSELPLVRFGIEATLSQMLEEGVMHADPHGGNLLRARPRDDDDAGDTSASTRSRPRRLLRKLLRRPPPPSRLAYLDFGLVSHVPLQVREGLVCAVALLLFDRDVGAVADLFPELMLMPPEELAAADTRQALEAALSAVAGKVLVEGGRGGLPTLRFEALIAELALIAPRFALTLPPYFLNNARGLATLEGMAKSADPSFDVLQAVYPFALRRLLADPTNSPLLRSTLDKLTRDASTGQLDLSRVRRLLDEAAMLSGRPKRQLLLEAARTPGGRALGLEVATATAARAWRGVRRSKDRRLGNAVSALEARRENKRRGVQPKR